MPLIDIKADEVQIQSLKPLINSKVQSLAIGDSVLPDLSPLMQMPLTRLTITNSSLVDCTPIAQCSLLRKVTLTGNQIVNPEVLFANLSLDSCDLRGNPISDTKVLYDASPLSLYFDYPQWKQAQLLELTDYWQGTKQTGARH